MNLPKVHLNIPVKYDFLNEESHFIISELLVLLSYGGFHNLYFNFITFKFLKTLLLGLLNIL